MLKMPSQSTSKQQPAAAQVRRDALLRICSDSGTATVLSKSLASIIQSSENALFRRTCVELIRRWGSSQNNRTTDGNASAPNKSPNKCRVAIGKPIVDETLVQLHRTFVGDVKRTN